MCGSGTSTVRVRAARRCSTSRAEASAGNASNSEITRGATNTGCPLWPPWAGCTTRVPAGASAQALASRPIVLSDTPGMSTGWKKAAEIAGGKARSPHWSEDNCPLSGRGFNTSTGVAACANPRAIRSASCPSTAQTTRHRVENSLTSRSRNVSPSYSSSAFGLPMRKEAPPANTTAANSKFSGFTSVALSTPRAQTRISPRRATPSPDSAGPQSSPPPPQLQSLQA